MYYGGLGYGMGYGGFYWDNTYILIIIGILLCGGASLLVRSTFSKYSTVRASCGLTGADIARKILNSNDMGGVNVRQTPGSLSDHFDPRDFTVNLSREVYDSSSISAIAVAAHECGHVLQHRDNYLPYNFRKALVPVVNLGSSLSWVLILVGVFMGGLAASASDANPMGRLMIQVGILCFSLAVLFQLVTLPVEFNASRRALKILAGSTRFTTEEIQMARKVLTAAALTYVAGAISSILQLLRIILLFGGRRRD